MARITKAPEERKKEIIQTARTLFFEKGYNETSIKDIVEEVDVAQGLFYYYFTSKEEVFNAAMEDYADIYIDKLAEILLSEGIELTKKIVILLETCYELEGAGGAMFLKAMEAPENKEMHNRISIHVLEMLLPKVVKLLEEEKDKGTIEIENPLAVSSYILFGAFGAIHYREGDISVREATEDIIKMVSKTLSIDEEEFKKETHE